MCWRSFYRISLYDLKFTNTRTYLIHMWHFRHPFIVQPKMDIQKWQRCWLRAVLTPTWKLWVSNECYWWWRLRLNDACWNLCSTFRMWVCRCRWKKIPKNSLPHSSGPIIYTTVILPFPFFSWFSLPIVFFPHLICVIYVKSIRRYVLDMMDICNEKA